MISPCQALDAWYNAFSLMQTNSVLRAGLKTQFRLALEDFLNATRIILRNLENANARCYRDCIVLIRINASQTVLKVTEMEGSFLRLINGGDH